MPSAKAAAALQQSLGRMYGDTVQIRYYDVAEDGASHREATEFVHEEGLPLPVVLLNGRLLYAGTLDLLRIAIDVAEERQRLVSDHETIG